MSRFGKYLGFLKIKINEDEYEVRPTLRHKQKLLGIQQNAKKGLSEGDWEQQHGIFKEILKTSLTEEELSDPEEVIKAEKEIDSFLLCHDMDFMMALYVGFGWAKEEDLVDLKEELKKKAM